MNPRVFSQSLTARFLQRLADAIYRHPRWFVWPQFALAALCLVYTVHSLEFLTDRNALVGAEKEYHRIYLNFRREFPVQDELAVVVESDSQERNRQIVERLGGKVAGIAFVIELSFLKGREKLKGYEVFSLVDYESE